MGTTKDLKPSLGIFIASSGKPSLFRTLWSLAYQHEGVADVLVVGDGFHEPTRALCDWFLGVGLPVRYVATKRTNDGGGSQRNYALKHVKGDYVLYTNEDSVLLPRSLAMVQETAAKRPGRPILARVKTEGLGILWQEPGLDTALDGRCLVLPNDKAKLGYFETGYFGDQCYIHTSLKPYESEWAWVDVVLSMDACEWRTWPLWGMQGSTTWACDINEDDEGYPGGNRTCLLLEEDGEHFILSISERVGFDIAYEVAQFGLWACQGRDAWFRVASDDKVMRGALEHLKYQFHTDNGTTAEYCLDWPPAWWPPVPRFTQTLDSLGQPNPDWRENWGA